MLSAVGRARGRRLSGSAKREGGTPEDTRMPRRCTYSHPRDGAVPERDVPPNTRKAPARPHAQSVDQGGGGGGGDGSSGSGSPTSTADRPSTDGRTTPTPHAPDPTPTRHCKKNDGDTREERGTREWATTHWTRAAGARRHTRRHPRQVPARAACPHAPSTCPPHDSPLFPDHPTPPTILPPRPRRSHVTRRPPKKQHKRGSKQRAKRPQLAQRSSWGTPRIRGDHHLPPPSPRRRRNSGR